MQFCHSRVKTRSSAGLSPAKSSGVELQEQGEWCKNTEICAQLLREKKKSCKVPTHGTGRAAEGVETNEMESLQRKFVFYYLYDWTGIGKKGICRWRDDVRAKTTLFYHSCNNQYPLELLQLGLFLCEECFWHFLCFPKGFSPVWHLWNTWSSICRVLSLAEPSQVKSTNQGHVYLWVKFTSEEAFSFHHSAPHFSISTMFLHWHSLPHCLLLHRPYSIFSLTVSGIFFFISLFMLSPVTWLVSDWAPVRRR